MSMTVAECASTPKQITTSGLQLTGPGKLMGIFVSSATGGSIKVWDSTTASGTVLVDTVAVVAGTYYPMPFGFVNGCFVTITGTVSCTVGIDAP